MKLPKVNPKQLNFVPDAEPVCSTDVSVLERFINNSRKLLVLTGAGLSTESGIPDYRSEKVGLYARTNRRPMKYQEFISSDLARQKYWARSFVGWPKFSSFQPNVCHWIFSEWERVGKVNWLVTQNVDALHTKAGSHHVTELHGCLHRVLCLDCGDITPRWDLQTRFAYLNHSWSVQSLSDQIAPDGDVMLSDQQVRSFKVPACHKCGGILKPDVVFFGDNVSKSTVNFVFQKVAECDSVLVAGSSLSVFSGYRFLHRAAELRKNIAIINIGQTRADHLANVKVNGRCGEILSQIKLGDG